MGSGMGYHILQSQARFESDFGVLTGLITLTPFMKLLGDSISADADSPIRPSELEGFYGGNVNHMHL